MNPKIMKAILILQWAFSVFLIVSALVSAMFIQPKADAVQGNGWNIPFWPFVIVIGVFSNPLIWDLIRYWLRQRTEIAKAEHPDNSQPTVVAQTQNDGINIVKAPEMKAP